MPEIGLNSWLYASFPAWTPSYTLVDAIKHIDENEFDTIEIGAASPHAWPPYMEGDRLQHIKESLDDSDLSVSSICPALGGGPGPNPASPIQEERDAARDHYIGCLDVADAVNSDIVIWLGGWHLIGQSYDDAWEKMSGVFNDVVKEAEDQNKTLAIEATPADSNLVNTPDDQLKLLEQANSESVGVMFDTAHAIAEGDSPTRYVEELGEELVHLHLADSDRLPPGEGSLSFRPMLDRLEQIGYDGSYTVEIFGGHLNPDEAAWTARTNLEQMFSEV